jgi:hypothetical protein
MHRRGREIITPSAERLAALDPDRFDVPRLQAHYTGAADYYPDDDESADDQGLFERLIDFIASRTSEEDYPSDAGEEIQSCIARLRTGLALLDHGSVLLIRLC